MNDLADQIVESWMINNRVNLRLIEHLGIEDLATTLSTRGGRTVGMQLVHMYWLRREKLKKADKHLFAGLEEIARDQGNDKALLTEGFIKSGELYAQLIRESLANGGKVKGFKRGIIAKIGYFIAHEAHHRGHIILTLKQAGRNPDSNFKMSLWEWNKI